MHSFYYLEWKRRRVWWREESNLPYYLYSVTVRVSLGLIWKLIDFEEETVILVGFQPVGQTVSLFRVVKPSQSIGILFKFVNTSINKQNFRSCCVNIELYGLNFAPKVRFLVCWAYGKKTAARWVQYKTKHKTKHETKHSTYKIQSITKHKGKTKLRRNKKGKQKQT